MSRRRKTFFNIAGFVALSVVVFIAKDDIMNTWKELPSANPWLLLMILPTQLIGYHFNVKYLESFFRTFGHQIRYRRLFKAYLETNFVNQVFPTGGVSGASYLAMRFKKDGVSTAQATMAIFGRFIILFFTYQLFLILAVGMLAVSGSANSGILAITAFLVGLFVTGSLFLAYVVSDKGRITGLSGSLAKITNAIFRFLHINKRDTFPVERVERVFGELHNEYNMLTQHRLRLKMPTLFLLVVNFTEVLTIYWVYLAFGEAVNPGAVIIAFAVANFAGTIAAIPGGVGIYETLMTIVMVSAGVPAAISLTATVTYRVINLAISLPIGYFFYQRAIDKTAHN